MRTHLLTFLVVVAAVSVGGLAAPSAGQAGSSLSIETVAVTPSPPPVDEDTTVELTVRNRETGGGAYDIHSVALLATDDEDGELETLAEVDRPGRVQPGSARTIDLVTSFDTAGDRQLRLRVAGETSVGDRVVLQREFDVAVGGEQPRIDIDAERAYADTETPVSVTVANGLPTDARNVDVRLESDDVDVLSSRTVHSRLESGESETFEFPVVAASAGEQTAAVSVAYTDDDGDRHHLRERATLDFRPLSELPTPRITVDAEDVIEGTRSSVNLTVTNGLDRDVRDLEVGLAGDVDVLSDRRVVSRLESGESATVDFPTVAQAGTRDVTVTVRYEIDGRTRTVEERRTIDVDPLEDEVDLEARQVGDGTAVAVDVFNLGNAPIENAVVRAESPNATVSRALIDRLDAGRSRAVRLNVTGVDAAGVELEVGATYDIGDREGTSTTTARLSSNPGTIQLTGVQVEDDGDRLHITGSASNAGLTEANSVLVSVVDSDTVDPEPPNREYFVGTVPASDFVSFDLFASVDGNVSSIPVQITYLVDGERRDHRVEIPYDSGPVSTPADAQDSGLGIVPVLGGAVVLLGIGAVIYVGWRNRDGGD